MLFFEGLQEMEGGGIPSQVRIGGKEIVSTGGGQGEGKAGLKAEGAC